MAGVGEVAAITLQVVRAAATLYLQQTSEAREVVADPQRLRDFWRMRIGGLLHEVFGVAYLDSAGAVLTDGVEILQEGTVDRAAVYRETNERTVDDVWRVSMLQPADRTENCGFPTQKPEAVLHRIVQSTSRSGRLVADFFCGSGTTLAVAEKLGRRWIGCDLGRWGIHVTRKRLLGIENCKPFEVLNLGKYERQYWQGVTFGEKTKPVTVHALYEYLAFILKLMARSHCQAWHMCTADGTPPWCTSGR